MLTWVEENWKCKISEFKDEMAWVESAAGKQRSICEETREKIFFRCDYIKAFSHSHTHVCKHDSDNTRVRKNSNIVIGVYLLAIRHEPMAEQCCVVSSRTCLVLLQVLGCMSVRQWVSASLGIQVWLTPTQHFVTS